jgi:heme exporter protein B
MTGFTIILERELRLAFRQGADSLMALGFFILAVVLFPLGVGPEPNLLARIGPGIIWVAALLAALLSLERIFQSDYEDGSLELLALAPPSLECLALAKIAAHWLTTGLPLIVVSPLLALILHVESAGLSILMLALALGTPILSLIGGFGAALVLGARRAGVLLSLLVLPLYVPVLIFGVAAVEAAVNDVSVGPHLSILAALLLAALPLAPLGAAAALRQALR